MTGLADAESRAVRINSVAYVRIPGLLQIREHSLALCCRRSVSSRVIALSS
ncbi:Scr1 family TA system antitoxin-like transcriptional regulator [Saccharopolyspora spinosa]|uniref:Scr1 family TA system antitoxin-like transcriptional regulator n=1 Tax=Saccharopolyspora spinosa TaxID=60894 RepID=UPI0037489C7B